MGRRASARSTDAELAILRVLWTRGPSTVREVHAQLPGHATTGYTTVLKLMQIMAAKGLLLRDERERSHVYYPRDGEAAMQRRLIDDLLARAFNGSASTLVMRALSGRPAPRHEIDELRRFLDTLEAPSERTKKGGSTRKGSA